MAIQKRIVALAILFIMLVTWIPITIQAAAPAADESAYGKVTASAREVEDRQFTTALPRITAYDITGRTAASISADLQSLIDAASAGDAVTVKGTKNNENADISLTIHADIAVVWAADSKDLSIHIAGDGVFEVAEGSKIEVTGKDAIVAEKGHIVVSGGEVSVLRKDINDWAYRSAIRITGVGKAFVTGGKISASRNASAIYLDRGEVTVKGGELSVVGETTSNGIPTNVCYTIRIEDEGSVVITGGIVRATGAQNDNHAANIGWGLIAYLDGTCENDLGFDMFEVWDYYYYGVAIKVNNGSVPAHGTQDGMSAMPGGNPDIKYVTWDTSDTIPLIKFDYEGYKNEVPWVLPDNPTGPVNAQPVLLLERNLEFNTLNEAIAEATRQGLSTYTLQIVGDVAEPNSVIIDQKVSILSDGGPHTVSLGPGAGISVESGGELTLGSGGLDQLILTSNYNTVTVTNGTVYIKDGVALQAQSANATALLLSGANAGGEISGGRLEGNTCVALEKGAQLSKISGGRYIGTDYALYLKDAGTKIGEISSGAFYQTENIYGHTVLLQDYAEIDKISSGYFEAVKGIALTILRGAVVGEISGGEFTAPLEGTMASNGWNAAVWLQNDSAISETGIHRISGGHFYGSHFGVITMYSDSNAGSFIGEITGGLFEGIVGLQNDERGTIGKITGGEYIASQGMLNVGTINEISGNAHFLGKSSYGIFNYYTDSSTYGLIEKISGPDVWIEGSNNGIANAAQIDLIDGGTFIGGFYAINCDGLNKGKINEIVDGVFWGNLSEAIGLSYKNDPPDQLILERVLTSPAIEGVGRYWGVGGKIFNDDSRVTFPSYNSSNPYRMSKNDDTKAVPSVTSDTEFKFLTFYNAVTVLDSYADRTETGAGEYKKEDVVTIKAGERYGCTFDGWIIDEGNIVLADASDPTTTFTMPDHPVTVTATWICPPGKYMVTVYNSYASPDGDGSYDEDEPVYLDAGADNHPLGYSFAYWLTDDVDLADATDPTATFTMPDHHVTIYAIWTSSPGFYTVEVEGSYASYTGAGGYREGDTVTVYAGSHPSGYSFAFWYTEDGVSFDDSTNPAASFTMPAKNVKVTAIWAFRQSFYTVTVHNSYAPYTGAGGYRKDDGVIVHAGTQPGFRFTGWLVLEGGAQLTDPGNVSAPFIMPAANVVLEATWEPMIAPVRYTVTVQDSYAAVTGAGNYRKDEIVYIHAGSRSGYSFNGWTVPQGAVSTFTPGQANETTSFIMPGEHVTVRANWRESGGGGGGGGEGPGTTPPPVVLPEEPEEEPPVEEITEPPVNPPEVTPPDTERPPMPPIPEGKEGVWRWDEDTGMWVFDEAPPLGFIDPDLPKTGDAMIDFALSINFIFIGAGIIWLCRKKERGAQGQE